MFYISQVEIQNFGVSEKTIFNSILRYRQSKSKSWVNIKDPYDKRKVLIDLDSIPEGTRKKYNIPTGEEYAVQKRLEQEKQLQKEKELKSNLNKQALVNAYNNDYIPFIVLYEKLLSYSPTVQQKYSVQFAKEHAFWLKMVEITGTKYAPYRGKVQEGFEMFIELKSDLVFFNNMNTLIYFRKKLKEIRRGLANNQDVSELIADGSMRERPNATKVTDFHQSLVFSFLSHPKQYSYRVVNDLVNHHCEQEGLKTITESWIKKKMREDNQFKTAVYKYRNGEKYFKDNLLSHAVRNITPYPGNVWMIDGTPVQFWCWNENRTKIVRLNLFAIIDVCSRKIVGFDIAYTEDRFNIIKALKLAVLSEGHLPAEIVSDNFSAKKTEEIQDLKQQMEKLGVLWRFSKVKNPQDKSYIERFFGAFQSVECALYDDYLGEGITSKRLNARPNVEYLKSVAEKQGYPTYTEMLNRIGTMIAKYNERTLKEKQSPNVVYKTFPKPSVVEMDSIKTSLMFWSKTTYTVKRGMVKITVRKTEHSYEIKDHTAKMMYQNKKVVVRYDENDLDRVMLFDEYDQVICECKKSIKIHIADADRTEKDVLNTIKTVSKQKSYAKHIDKFRDNLIKKGLEQVNKDSLELVHPLSLEKNQINSEESKQLLELFKYQNSITESGTETKKEPKTLGVLSINKKDNYEDIVQKKSPRKQSSLKVVEKASTT